MRHWKCSHAALLSVSVDSCIKIPAMHTGTCPRGLFCYAHYVCAAYFMCISWFLGFLIQGKNTRHRLHFKKSPWQMQFFIRTMDSVRPHKQKPISAAGSTLAIQAGLRRGWIRKKCWNCFLIWLLSQLAAKKNLLYINLDDALNELGILHIMVTHYMPPVLLVMNWSDVTYG